MIAPFHAEIPFHPITYRVFLAIRSLSGSRRFIARVQICRFASNLGARTAFFEPRRDGILRDALWAFVASQHGLGGEVVRCLPESPRTARRGFQAVLRELLFHLPNRYWIACRDHGTSRQTALAGRASNRMIGPLSFQRGSWKLRFSRSDVQKSSHPHTRTRSPPVSCLTRVSPEAPTFAGFPDR